MENYVKIVILSLFMLIISYLTFASEYTVPLAAYSVYAEDLDLDGDNDIVVGHNYNSQTEWSGVSILENNGYGEFTLIDSIFLYGWQTNVYAKIINNDEYPDIIGRHFEDDNQYMTILENNQGIYIPYYYSMEYGISDFVTGDIDADNDIDIVITSHNGQFWGVLYNNGSGQFSEPEYHYVTGYYPVDIACGNLNEDNRNDIAICAQKTEVYFSYETGFQCLTLEENNFKNEINIADMDYDGDNDIVVLVDLLMMGYTGITIYENICNDNFYRHNEVLFQPALGHFEISDLNNDNFPDIICTGYDGIYILYNEGNFSLSEPQYFSVANFGEYSRRSFCADVDGNGFNDIITIRYLHAILPANLNILFNDGNGNFMEEPQVGINQNCILNIENCKLSNYPNPLNSITNIFFSIPEEGFVELKVYNIKGRLVKELTNQKMKGGEHNVIWNGKDQNNRCCSSGIYLMNLKVNGKNRKISKLILLK